MNILENIQQGSEQWLAIRKTHLTASEAPAALGKSKYTSRTELLNQKASGVSKEIDSFTQALFDKGHKAEATARAIAEKIIQEDLYPVTATLEVEGLSLLASFDGCTIDESIIWEHKLYSESLANEVRSGALSDHYTVQLDQQLLISGASKCLFMTSDGTEENLAWCWYEPSQEKFDALISGWKQFQRDLETHVIAEVVEAPKADAIMRLPALAVQVKGEIIASNLPDFKAQAESFIASINTDLKTDEDFANADATVKFCEKAEKELDTAKAAIIAQTADIDEIMRTVDHIQAQLRDKRLMLDKLVKTKKDSIKLEIMNRGKWDYQAFVDALEKPFAPIRLVLPAIDLAGAIKNKRTLASLNDAVDTAVAQAKIVATNVANALREQITWYETAAADYKFLFNDLQQIVFKPADDFQLLVNTRIESHKAAEAKKAEEAAKREEQAKAIEAGNVEAEKAVLKSSVQVQQAAPIAEVVSMKPTREQIIFAVAMHFKTDARTAASWIEAEFSATAKAA